MKKWGMALGILLLAAGICGAEEPAVQTDKVPDAAVAGQKTEVQKAPDAAAATEKAPEQKAPDAAAATEKAPEQKAPDAAAGAEKAPEQKAPEAPVKVDKDKASYIIGLSFGRQMKGEGIELKVDSFIKGFNDSQSGAKPAMTDEEMQQIMMSYQGELAAKKEAETRKIAEENKTKEDAFLWENKKKEGVQTLPSGLQYKVVKEGSGVKPSAKDSVTVNYRGTLIDGKEFDSSYKRNEAVTFKVNEVIPGWTEALQLMKSGSKWEIYIPSKLAYGEMGAGGVIPPNSALIFEVELLSVKPAEEKKAATKTGAQTKAKAAKPAAKTAGQGAGSGN